MDQPSTFTTIYSNNLQQITMISGDEQKFIYEVVDENGTPLSLTYDSCYVKIFKYGDPYYVMQSITGSKITDDSGTNKFYIIFSGSNLSGVYQQQVIITDSHGGVHIPSQGKIVIFPSSG